MDTVNWLGMIVTLQKLKPMDWIRPVFTKDEKILYRSGKKSKTWMNMTRVWKTLLVVGVGLGVGLGECWGWKYWRGQ